jgi:hypothetical protein
MFLPFAVVAALAVLWTGGWFYLSTRAGSEIDNWRAGEAARGRVYDCGARSIGGFPFRIEVSCAQASAKMAAFAPALAFAIADAHVTWQVYQPDLLIAELTSPFSLGEVGKPPGFLAHWQVAQASIRVAAAGLERVSMVLEAPSVSQAAGGVAPEIFRASHIELHGRPSAASSPDRPSIDIAVEALAAAAPALHPLVATPFDADGTGVLHGVPDLSPRPLPMLLRDWQARGGSLEISRLRVQQGDVIAVGAGTVALTPSGSLDGQLQITVVGLDKVLALLGIDRMVSQGDMGSVLGALNRLLPGLGDVARQNAPASIVAGLGALGQGTTLEGKPAVTMPLRFDDGAILFGPLMIGRAPRLF